MNRYVVVVVSWRLMGLKYVLDNVGRSIAAVGLLLIVVFVVKALDLNTYKIKYFYFKQDR